MAHDVPNVEVLDAPHFPDFLRGPVPIDVLHDVQLRSPVVVRLQRVPNDAELGPILPDILRR